MSAQPEGQAIVNTGVRGTAQVRFLTDPTVWLWCWDIVDAGGRPVESSWEHHWAAYKSSGDALTAGLRRLLERTGSVGGARKPGRTAPGRRLVIVGRSDLLLYESLKKAFARDESVEVILDRRLGERQRQRGVAAGRRRSRTKVDAQLRSRGFVIIDLSDTEPAPGWEVRASGA